MENNSNSIRGQFLSAKPLFLFIMFFAIFVPVMTFIIIKGFGAYALQGSGAEPWIWTVVVLVAILIAVAIFCLCAIGGLTLEIDDSKIKGKKLFVRSFNISFESLRRVNETAFSGITFTDDLGKNHTVYFINNRTDVCKYLIDSDIQVFNTIFPIENPFTQSIIQKSLLKRIKLVAKLSLVFSVVFGVISGFAYASSDNWYQGTKKIDWGIYGTIDYPCWKTYAEPSEMFTTWIAAIFLLMCIVAIILYNMMKDCTLTANDKFITGRTLFGKAVTFPLDNVSSVSAKKTFNCIKIVSNGKSKSFLALENYLDLHRAISEKINAPKIQPIVLQAPVIQSTENTQKNESGNTIKELREYKELLEQGIISEEEFAAKKKQILGI